MKRKITEMSLDALYARKRDLDQTVRICEDFLASCPNTLLGPLGARAEIKRCNKEINLIIQELERRK